MMESLDVKEGIHYEMQGAIYIYISYIDCVLSEDLNNP